MSTKQPELLDLDDYCLIKIFRNLSLTNLSATAATCRRLRDITHNHVYKHQAKLKRVDVKKFRDRCTSKGHSGATFNCNVDCINGYFQSFGHLAAHILLNGHRDDVKSTKEIYKCIADYCTVALTSLRVRHLNLDIETIACQSLAFANLRKLKIDTNDNWCALLQLCPNLTELSVSFNINADAASLEKFATVQLRALTVFKAYARPRREPANLTDHLQRFLDHHRGLTTLTLRVPSYVSATILGQHLEELTLDMSLCYDGQPIYELSRLRKVDFGPRGHPFKIEFLKRSAAVHCMENLTHHAYEIDEATIDGLSRFHRLRYLTLNPYALNVPDHCWQQLSQLTSLIELRLDIKPRSICSAFALHLTGAHRTLRKLQLFHSKSGLNVGDNLTANLARFEHLEELALIMDRYDDRVADNWKPFKRLTRLKKFETSRGQPSDLANLFVHLGARDTLETIVFSQVAITDQLIGSIVQFGNLRKIIWQYSTGFSSVDLKALDQLHRIRKIELDFRDTVEPSQALLLFDLTGHLVEKWPSLKKLEFKLFVREKNADEFYRNALDRFKNNLKYSNHFFYVKITSHRRHFQLKLSK